MPGGSGYIRVCKNRASLRHVSEESCCHLYHVLKETFGK